MAEYKVVDAEQLDAGLTEMADEVRALVDTDDKMTMEQMTANVAQANEDIAAQADLIAQIRTALDGKASGSGEDFIGVKYSDFDTQYGSFLPKVADGRPLQNWFDKYPSAIVGTFSNNGESQNNNKNYALETIYLPDGITSLGDTFRLCTKLKNIYGNLQTVINTNGAFYGCCELTDIPYMPNLAKVQDRSFYNCKSLTKVKFYNTLTQCASNVFSGCSNLTDIYVPWALGEVDGAPWGATNANLTIHYNTTYDKNHNPIVSEV